MFVRALFRFSSSGKLTHYEVLEVHHTASARQIKHNYHRLAKIYHPDVYKGQDLNRFRMVQEAYSVLKNPLKRKDYDLTVRGLKQPNPEEPVTEGEPEPATEETDGKVTFKDYKSKTEGMRPDDFAEKYQEFMSKPINSSPEDAVIYENPFMRQQSKEYKEQKEFMLNRKDPQFTYTNYQDQVKEYILSRNEQLREKKDDPAQAQAKSELLSKRIRWGVGAFMLVTFPFIVSGLERRKRIERDMEDERKRYDELVDQLEIRMTQARFVY